MQDHDDEWNTEFDFSDENDTALLDEALEEEQEEQDKSIKIAIVGRPNVGKSTLTNRIFRRRSRGSIRLAGHYAR